MASGDQAIIDFKLGHKKIGLFLSEVKEIIEPIPAIKVPMTHPFFKGFISLRGEVIPLIDSPKVMHTEENPYNKEDEKYVIASAGRKKMALLFMRLAERIRTLPKYLLSARNRRQMVCF
ncbi:chemotaxis protein CheW [Terrilactibacillus sp. S3-3]|nr:chemotaxis protein CheW [Terrilactibacillus sp. S3-3]